MCTSMIPSVTPEAVGFPTEEEQCRSSRQVCMSFGEMFL